jgi:hypothetical protein
VVHPASTWRTLLKCCFLIGSVLCFVHPSSVDAQAPQPRPVPPAPKAVPYACSDAYSNEQTAKGQAAEEIADASMAPVLEVAGETESECYDRFKLPMYEILKAFFYTESAHFYFFDSPPNLKQAAILLRAAKAALADAATYDLSKQQRHILEVAKSLFQRRYNALIRLSGDVGTVSSRTSTSAPIAVATMLPSAPSEEGIQAVCQRHFKDDGFIIQYCMTAVSRRIAIEDSDGNPPSGYTPPLNADLNCASHIQQCADTNVVDGELLELNDELFAGRRAVEFTNGKSPDETRVALREGVPCNIQTYDISNQHWETWEYGSEGTTCIGSIKYTFVNGKLHDVFNGGTP